MKATRLSVVASLWDTTFVLPRMKPRTRTANTGKISLIKIVNMNNSRMKAGECLLSSEVPCVCARSIQNNSS